MQAQAPITVYCEICGEEILEAEACSISTPNNYIISCTKCYEEYTNSKQQ